MRKFFALAAVMLLSVAFASAALAADGDIKLPAPEKSGGVTLLDAVANRQSATEFADVDLTPQQLSNLLWVTAGINRPDGKLTFATAMNARDIIVYVLNRDGVYRYDPAENTLTLIEKGDHRADSGTQPFVATAALNLAYVQDVSRWKDTPVYGKIPAEALDECGFAHAGSATQNAYLYAASQGWGARTRMSFDKEKLPKLLKLNEDQSVKLVQTIGPKP